MADDIKALADRLRDGLTVHSKPGYADDITRAAAILDHLAAAPTGAFGAMAADAAANADDELRVWLDGLADLLEEQ